MNSVVTKFRGNFTLSERIQIHGAAPLLMLLVLSIFFTLVLLLTEIPNKYIIWLWATLSIAPIGSLIPHKLVVESDGYQIVRCAQRLNLSVLQTIQELLRGITLGLRYILLGSWRPIGRMIPLCNDRISDAYEFFRKGEFKNALAILEEELKKNPNDSEICNNVAWCYAELGTDFGRAIILAQKAVDLKPAEALYHDTLGWCYFKKGDIDNAKRSLIQAMTIDPHNSVFQNHLRKIEEAIFKTKQ